MTDTLIVQLTPPAGVAETGFDCPSRWLHMPGGAVPDAPGIESGPLSGLLQQPPAADCDWIVLLPGEEVLTTAVSLPKKRRRQALNALPFMLEDSLASDVALEHLAICPENLQGGTPVAAIRKQRLGDWLQLFQGAGVTPARMLPDYAALEEDSDAWQVLLADDRALVRRPDSTGFSAPVSRLTLLLNSQRPAESETARSLVWIRRAGDSVPALSGDWRVSERVVDDPVRSLLEGAADASINLLQGEFKVARQDDWSWRPWAKVAVLAAAAVCLGLLKTGLETARLNGENERLQASIFELAREALPESQQIRDPQAQLLIAWRQLENGTGGDSEFLSLLNQVSPFISRQPVTVHGIHFRDGDLTIALRGSSLQQLDDIRQRVEQQGLQASLLNAGTEAGSARSNLVIRQASLGNPRSTG